MKYSYTSDVMNFLETIIIVIQLASVTSKRYKHISSESVENILYYKDCNHKQRTTAPPMLRSAPQQQECKMCCTMCCGDQCVDTHQLSMGKQGPSVNIEPKPPQPDIKPRERKKIKPQMPIMPPVPERRGLAFTKENIKSLISKDEDIRKILKDLVRVTMQKVDLMQLINTRRNMVKKKSEESADDSDYENDL